MSIYRKRSHEIPALNTASLPDLIFTILFFFMLVTQMRKVAVKVKYQLPQGTELTKLVKKSAISYVYIGQPMDELGNIQSDSTMIQLNDKFVSLPEMQEYLINERAGMDETDRKQMSVSIRADKDVPMGTIIDLKQTLRKANTLNINYTAIARTD
ncbi:biopolymer transporter ExbD [Prevotella sp. HUN102]|uniref:ExbD/TolR family protein n=1 Tax=Prevotella sp. HUN102 TaxID=1392486 RepID=UPI00048A7F3C|nr:biopolymer transporter ExbD [Prevotella sp. HUN102]